MTTTATLEAALTATPRDAAMAEVLGLDARVQDLTRQRDEATRELAAIRAGSGGDDPFLDDLDGESVRARAARATELTMTLELTSGALERVAQVCLDARREVLRAEADELDAQLDDARAAVEAHDAKSARLLAALQQHTAQEYTPVVIDDEYARAHGDRFTIQIPVRDLLQGDVDRLIRRQAILRAVAEGLNPSSIVSEVDLMWGRGRPVGVEELPESVYGPNPVLAAPGWPAFQPWSARAAELQEVLDEHGRTCATAQSQVQSLELGLAAGFLPNGGSVHRDDVRHALKRWREAVADRNNLVDAMRRQQPASLLAELTGLDSWRVPRA